METKCRPPAMTVANRTTMAGRVVYVSPGVREDPREQSPNNGRQEHAITERAAAYLVSGEARDRRRTEALARRTGPVSSPMGTMADAAAGWHRALLAERNIP